MNIERIQSMRPAVQRYMATQTGVITYKLEQDMQGDVDWEAAATALLLEAYLTLSDKTNPANAKTFMVAAIENLDELLTVIVHDDAMA